MQVVDHFGFLFWCHARPNGVCLKSGRNDRYLNGLPQCGVFSDSHDDIGISSGFVLNEVVDFPNFIEGNFVFVGPGDNQQQYVLGSMDSVVVEQRTVQGSCDGVGGTVGATRLERAHKRCAAAGKNGFGIPEVNVGAVVVGDDFGDTSCGRCQNLVGLVEAGLEAQIAVYLAQFVVVHHNQGIHDGTQFLNPGFCLAGAYIAFKSEGQGHNSYRENAHFLSRFGNNGCSPCSRAASHSSRDKGHFGVRRQQGFDLFHAFLGGTCPNLRIGSCAHPFGEVLPKLDFGFDGTVLQGLRIGVADHKIYAVDSSKFHVVHGIASSSTDANDFDHGRAVFGKVKMQTGGLFRGCVHGRLFFVDELDKFLNPGFEEILAFLGHGILGQSRFVRVFVAGAVVVAKRSHG